MLSTKRWRHGAKESQPLGGGDTGILVSLVTVTIMVPVGAALTRTSRPKIAILTMLGLGAVAGWASGTLVGWSQETAVQWSALAGLMWAQVMPGCFASGGCAVIEELAPSSE